MHWIQSWRSLIRNRLRSSFTILSIILGVSSIFAVISTVETSKVVTDQQILLYTGNADYAIYSNQGIFSQEILEETKTHYNVSDAIGLMHKQSYIDLGTPIGRESTRIRLTGLSNFNSELLSLDLLAGNLNNNGLIISKTTANLWQIGISDKLQLELPSGKIETQIGAIVKDTPLLEGPENWEEAPNKNWRALINLNNLQNAYHMNGKVQEVRLKLSDSESGSTVVSELSHKINNPDIYFQKIVLDEKQTNQLDEFYFMLYLIGGLAMLISGFIIYNTLYISVIERKSEIAIMKTVGFLPSQIKKIFIYEVFLLSLIGIVFGVPIGFLLGNLVQQAIFQSFQAEFEYKMVYSGALVISAWLGFLIPLISSFIPLNHAGKVDIIKTLRNLPDTKKEYGKVRVVVGGILFILAFIYHPLSFVLLLFGFIFLYPTFMISMTNVLQRISVFGFGWTLAAKNTIRTINRTSNMAFILSLSVALGIVVSSISVSVEKNIDTDIKKTFGGDILLVSNEPLIEEKISSYSGVEGVKEFIPLKERQVAWLNRMGETKQFTVISVDANWNNDNPIFQSESNVQITEDLKGSSEGILLGNYSFQEWGGEIGENLTIEVNDKVEVFKVVGVVDTSFYGGYTAFIDEDKFNNTFRKPYAYKGLLTTIENGNMDKVKSRLFERFPFDISNVQTVEEEIAKQKRAFPGIRLLFKGLLLITIMVAGIGIINALFINVMERIREITVMKVIAYTPQQMYKTIIAEGLIIGINGIIGGVLIAIPLIYFNAILDTDNVMEFIIPVNTIFISTIMGILVSCLASFLPAYRAIKYDMADGLKKG